MDNESIVITVDDVEEAYVETISGLSHLKDVYKDISDIISQMKFVEVPTSTGWVTALSASSIRNTLIDSYGHEGIIIDPWVVKELLTIHCLVTGKKIKKSDVHITPNFHVVWLAIFGELPDIV